ncbi:MAG: ParA family protein [Wenzhouxiangellaceae bacterium]
MQSIAVINPKGGCGKTTIATNLAAALAWEGQAVVLGDMDPQQSASDWAAIRPAEYPEVTGVSLAKGPARPPKGTDWLVLDTPAGLAGVDPGRLLRRVDQVLIPILPSFVDMRAAHRFLADLFRAKPVAEKRVRVGLIANRVRPNTIIYRELKGFLDQHSAPVVGRLRDSMNYVRAYEHGLSVSDLPAWQALPDWEDWAQIVAWVQGRRTRLKW